MTGWGLVLAMLITGIILFVWSGISQNLPWGVRSVKPDVTNEVAIQAIASEQKNGMLYLNGEIVALVAAKPKSYYSTQRFFAVELLTQLLVGIVLCLLLAQLSNLSLLHRQLIVLLAGLLIVATTDLAYWNWWGFSNLYTLGVSVNKLIGLQLASLVVSFLFLPAK